jgi:hypothetical protein
MALAGDHVQVLVDGYELTGDSHQMNFQDSRDLLEKTAFQDAVHHFLPGQVLSRLVHNGFLNADSARSHPVLKGVAVDGVVSVLLGQNAAPAVGDPTYSLVVQQEHYQAMAQSGQIVPFTANFPNRGDQSGWGTALAAPVTFTDTTTGSGVDHGAASSNGGAAFLHVLQAAGSDTYTLTVEGADDSGFSVNLTTLATFSLDASVLGSERVAMAGSIPRYTRFKAVRSGSAGDTVKIAVNLVRF